MLLGLTSRCTPVKAALALVSALPPLVEVIALRLPGLRPEEGVMTWAPLKASPLPVTFCLRSRAARLVGAAEAAAAGRWQSVRSGGSKKATMRDHWDRMDCHLAMHGRLCSAHQHACMHSCRTSKLCGGGFAVGPPLLLPPSAAPEAASRATVTRSAMFDIAIASRWNVVVLAWQGPRNLQASRQHIQSEYACHWSQE